MADKDPTRGEHGQKFVGEVRESFLAELRRTGHIYHSCKAAGISYKTMRTYMPGQPRHDPEFVEQYDQALQDYIASLKQEAHRRAVYGWKERPVIDKDGNVVGEVRKYSDTLLLALLKRHDHEFRERVDVNAKTEHSGKVEHAHSHGIDLEQAYKDMSPEQRAAWRTALEALSTMLPAPAEDGDAPPPKEKQH